MDVISSFLLASFRVKIKDDESGVGNASLQGEDQGFKKREDVGGLEERRGRMVERK